MSPLLARFWDQTRLHADQAVHASAATQSVRPEASARWVAVSELLCVGYGERAGAVITKGKTLMRARTTPSAGALYPFEVLVAFRGDSQYELYHYEVAGACLRPLNPVSEPDLVSLLPAQGDLSGAPAAIVAVIGRPGRSMRKYGRRGYLYTCLDMGHVATNITMAAEDAGYATTVHLRFDRGRAAKILGLEHLCLEPHALIALPDPVEPVPLSERVTNPFAVPIWRHDLDSGLEDSDVEEREAWQEVRTVSTYANGIRETSRLGSMLSVTADGTEQPHEVRLPRLSTNGPSAFRSAALRRRSAKGFVAATVDGGVLARTLSALGARTRVDCADGPVVGMRVLVRRVDGLDSGVFVYAPDNHALRPLGGDGGTNEALVAACMNQEVVRDAAALLALHAPVRPLLGRLGPQGLAELHFHAACAAQRLCLGAAECDLGITCLGGFDTGLVADLARLEPPEEVLYILAAGEPDEFAVKWDRAPFAYGHGLSAKPRTRQAEG